MKILRPIPLVLTGAVCLALAGLPSVAEGAVQNAAFRTAADALTTYSGWPAANAVEEVEGDQGYHSAVNDTNPWWKTDLGAVIPIQSVRVRARGTDTTYLGRINGCILAVYLSSDATGSPVFSRLINIKSGLDQTYVMPAGVYGRSVKLSYTGSLTMNLSEVWVYSENLARGCPGTMSTTLGGTYTAAKSLDGVRPAGNPNISHSDGSDANPWWKVDLQRVCAIDGVRLWNRTDCCGDRLSDLNLQILAEDNSTVLYDYKAAHGGARINPANAMGSPTVITLDFHADAIQGRYLKLIREVTAGNVIQLSEVEVFGTGLIENRPATSIAGVSATVNGFVNGDDSATSTTLYWGTVDRGTSWNLWANTNVLGITGGGTGVVSMALSGLTLNTTYFYRWRASNATAGTGYATATGAFRTLPLSDGLALWLDASAIAGLANGNSVTAWNDSSQGGYAFSQGTAAAQPTYYTALFGTKPVVSFDGGDSLWTGNLQAGWPSTNLTTFFVTKADGLTGNSLYRADSDDGANRFSTHYQYDNGNTYFDHGDINTTGRLAWGNTTPNTDLNLMCYWQAAGTGQQAYRNGALITSDANSSVFAYNGYKFLTGVSYQGDVGEMLFFNRALTTLEQGTVGIYLEKKYGLTTSYVPVDNTGGGTGVGTLAATVNGRVYSTDGGASTVVKVLWGTADGGAALGTWQNTNTVATITSPQAVACALSGLHADTLYFYRMYTSNAVSGSVWAESAARVQTQISTLSGLQAWLDAGYLRGTADGASVLTLTDLSGNGNHATQGTAANQPFFYNSIVGGKPVVRFDGAGDYLDGPGVNLTAQTILAVSRADATAPGLSGLFCQKGADFRNIRLNTATTWRTAGNGSDGNDFSNGGTMYINGTAGWTHNNLNHFVEAVATSANAFQFRISQANTFTPMRYFKGDLAEMMIFNRTLTALERAEVMVHLENKYGIATPFSRVANTGGATGVGITAATANGYVYTTDGGESTVVKLLWGTADGGATMSAWQNTNAVTTITTPQAVSYALSGFKGGRTYYYRFMVNNVVCGNVLAESTAVFKTDFQLPTADVVLWLAADAIPGVSDGQNVATWSDLSGNGRNATQATAGSQPLYVTGVVNGKPVVRNASGKTLSLTSTLDPMGKTIVLVHKQDVAQTAWTLALGGSLHTTTDTGVFCLTRSGAPAGEQINSAISSKQFAVNYLQTVVSNYRLWINGASIGTSANANTLTALSAVGNNFFGDVAEVIVLNGVLTDADRAELGVYLEEKYGIATPFVRVDNTGGATSVGSTAATANGKVYTTDGGESTVVKLLWGTTDGGGTLSAWQNTNTVTTITTPQTVSQALSGLKGGRTYYYRFMVNNVVCGNVLAESTAVFKTDFQMPSADVALWLAADTLIGVSDGQNVSSWTDLSGNGRHAAQATVGSQPTFATGRLNGKPAVSFNGSKVLNTGSIAGGNWPTTSATMFLVAQDDVNHSCNIVVAQPDDGNNRFLSHLPNGVTVYWDFGNLNVNGRVQYPYDGGYGAAAWNIWGYRVEAGVSMTIHRNGVQKASKAGATSTFNPAGKSLDVGNALQGDIAEVLIFNGALSANEQAEIGIYLESKYGLSTPYARVDNSGGAAGITPIAATLNGRVYTTDGGEDTVVKVFWGRNDGGAAAGAWDRTNTITTITAPQAVAQAFSGLLPGRTYFYRMYASNVVSGSVWAETAVRFETQASSVTSGLQLWLDADYLRGAADGATVSTWTDLSGNSQHATQGTGTLQPLFFANQLNGNPVVRFDGTDDRMDGPGVNLTARTIFVVSKLDASAAGLAGVFAQKGADAWNIRALTPTTWNAPGNAANSADFSYNGLSYVNGSAGFTHDNQYHILENVAVGSGAIQYRLSQDFMSRYFKGDLAEVLIYNRVLTAVERGEVGYYLRQKYGLGTGYARVDNADGATAITSTSVTLNGRVNYTDNGTSTVVKVCWGLADGGAAFGTWQNTADVATVTTPQTVAQAVAGLKGGRTYYYRFYVSNSISGSVWAPLASTFKTDFQLPSADVSLWLAADAIQGLSNGQTVETWPDLSGNGRHATQVTPGSRPQYVTGVVGGKPVVRNASGKTLSLASLDPMGKTIVLVHKQDASQTAWTLALNNDLHTTTDTGMFCLTRSGGAVRIDSAISSKQFAVNYLQTIAANYQFWINGVSIGTSANGSTLSALTTVGNNFLGDFAEIIVFNGTLTSADQAEIGVYLENKYGLSTSYARVDNSGGATGVDMSTATVNGRVYTTDGGESTLVKVFYGTADGGAAPGTWQRTNTVATIAAPQTVATLLSGLAPATHYYYRMAVSNAVSGWVWAESAARFETKFSTVNSGMVLWLDASYFQGVADATAVGNWPDLSGSGNDASQGTAANRPALYNSIAGLGAKPVVRFDGSNDYLDGPGANLTAQTIFMVLKVEATAPTLSGVFSQKGADAKNVRLGDTNPTWRAPANGANSGDFCNSGSVCVNGGLAYTHNNAYHILEEVASSATAFQYRLSQDQYSRWFKGDLAEVIIYNRTLTKDERREVGRYLMGKYGLAAAYGKYDLPAGTQDPVVWYDLDSHANMVQGQTVGTLFDFSGNNQNGASQATANYPTFRTNAPALFGGKPVVRFTGNDDCWYNFTERGDIRTVFWVIKEDSDATATTRFLLGDNDTWHFHRGGSKMMWDGGNASGNVLGGFTTVDGVEVNGTVTTMPTAASILAVRTTGNCNGSRLMNDRSIGARCWDGDLAEFLVYNRALSDSEIARVGYYLEKKYSLTTEYGKVDNRNGAMDIAQTTATLNGRLNDADDGLSTVVKVFYGTVDGGATHSWQSSYTFAAPYTAPTDLAAPVIGLSQGTVYYYRYYCSNTTGQVWSETAAVFETLPVSVTSGLQLWLDARVLKQSNGTPVKTWRDLTNNRLDVKQLTPGSRPTIVNGNLNGLATVSFGGSQTLNSGTLPGTWPTTQCTLFIVQQNDNTGQNNYPVSGQANADNNRFQFHLPWANTVYWDFGDSAGPGRLQYGYDGGTGWNIWMFDRTAAGMNIRRNGALKATKAGGSSFNPTGKTLMLGGVLQGDIAEVIVYNRELTADEHRTVGRYLSAKYAVNAAYPKNSLPAAAADPVLWVDADAIDGLADGAAVSTWYNLAGNANDFAKGSTGNPLYKLNQLHGKPVVRFDGADATYYTFNRINDIRTVFWVLREDYNATGGPRFLLGNGDAGGDTYHFHAGDNGEIWHGTHASPFILNGKTRLNGTPVNGVLTQKPKQYALVSVETTGPVAANRFVKDRNIGGRTWRGDLAELIIYNRALTDEQVTSVGQYLQGKYSIQPTVFMFR